MSTSTTAQPTQRLQRMKHKKTKRIGTWHSDPPTYLAYLPARLPTRIQRHLRQHCLLVLSAEHQPSARTGNERGCQRDHTSLAALLALAARSSVRLPSHPNPSHPLISLRTPPPSSSPTLPHPPTQHQLDSRTHSGRPAEKRRRERLGVPVLLVDVAVPGLLGAVLELHGDAHDDEGVDAYIPYISMYP